MSFLLLSWESTFLVVGHCLCPTDGSSGMFRLFKVCMYIICFFSPSLPQGTESWVHPSPCIPRSARFCLQHMELTHSPYVPVCGQPQGVLFACMEELQPVEMKLLLAQGHWTIYGFTLATPILQLALPPLNPSGGQAAQPTDGSTLGYSTEQHFPNISRLGTCL